MGYTFFYMHHPIDRVIHTTAFVTPVVEHWLERVVYIEVEVMIYVFGLRHDFAKMFKQSIIKDGKKWVFFI